MMKTYSAPKQDEEEAYWVEEVIWRDPHYKPEKRQPNSIRQFFLAYMDNWVSFEKNHIRNNYQDSPHFK